jgi:preprotein translocase subunit SecE
LSGHEPCAKILKMVTPTKFLSQVKTELKQVTWPTKADVVRLTTLVVAISLVVGAYIGVLDLFFTKLVELIIKK